jgi:DNA-directed RNA polymerase subunit RPC12/RpoP
MEKRQCKNCESDNIASSGRYWRCKDCGYLFLKHPRGRFEKNILNRPDKCPYCGCTSIISGGIRWVCKECCHSWMKIRHSRRKDLGERPVCPVCGAANPQSKGPTRWQCVNQSCLHQWSKGESVTHQISDLMMAKTIQI